MARIMKNDHSYQEDERNCEVDQAREDARKRNDQPREIDLRDKTLVSDDTVAGFGESIGEQLPGQKSGIAEQWIWNPVGRHLG
jgi:hypothetical protein